MSRARSSALREVGSFAVLGPRRSPEPLPDPLAHEVAAAVLAAVDHARARLVARLPAAALDAADQYFEERRRPVLRGA